MVDTQQEVTPREIRIFGLLWLAFMGALGAMALWRPTGLLGAATILGSAWLVSLLFNPESRRRQLPGALIPAGFGAIGAAGHYGPAWTVAGIVWAAGVAGALAIWAAPAFGRTLYFGWMQAALPLGWTITRVVLGIVFFGVITPVGLVMRLAGHDPMQRRFDRTAESYWIERKADPDPRRAFRQF